MAAWLTSIAFLLAQFHSLAFGYLFVQSGGSPNAINYESDEGHMLRTTARFGPISSAPGSEEESGGCTSDPLSWSIVSPNVSLVQTMDCGAPTVNYIFSFSKSTLFYGVWEYPWNNSISNENIDYASFGVFGWVKGVNWANARAPFFFTKSGIGIYFNTSVVGDFNFLQPDKVIVSFNASAINYFVIHSPDLKELLKTYMGLSTKIAMPPDWGYGPLFWSDDFEQDFHGGVTNAQENYFDVVDHLYYNRIRATGMVADRESSPIVPLQIPSNA
jgi:alpha-D-xyloside xylohydrolase